MKQWSVRILLAASMLLSLGSGVLWIRSHYRWDELMWSPGPHLYETSSLRGRIRVTLTFDYPSASTWQFDSSDVSSGQTAFIWSTPRTFDWSAGYFTDPDTAKRTDVWALLLPHWCPLLTGAIAPLIWTWRLWRRRRIAPGHCSQCGYDLRATPDRCPECGHAPAEVAG